MGDLGAAVAGGIDSRPHFLAERRLTVAAHVYSTGPAHALVDYAVPRAKEVVFIGLPLEKGGDVPSEFRRHVGGVLVETGELPRPTKTPDPLFWTRDFWLTVRCGLRAEGRHDLFVGTDGLLAGAGLALRGLGKTRHTVFWTIDYVPDRFGSTVLNRVYHAFDRICVARADETWNVSPRMEPARLDRGVRGFQRLVPVGTNRIEDPSACDRHRVVFLGHLLEKQGVQLMIEALPRVRKVIPDVTLLVVGDGPYRAVLERAAANFGVADAVEFTGFVESHTDAEQLLAGSGVGSRPTTPRALGSPYTPTQERSRTTSRPVCQSS